MPLLVRGLERVGDLPGDRVFASATASAPRASARRQRRPSDQLLARTMPSAPADHAVDGGDVRMVQRREHPRLAFEPREPIVVSGNVAAEP